MEGDYEQEIAELLEKLHFKSIEELSQAESISTDKIAHRCRLHPIIVSQYLMRLHEIILKTQLLSKRIPPSNEKQPLLHIGDIYPGVSHYFEEGELIEVLGRANSGKTTFMINCMKLGIQNGIKTILLSSGDCEKDYTEQIKQTFMSLKFTNLCELAMLIHIIGNKILEERSSTPYLVFIDCLSQVQQEEETVEFDSSEKFRRLINNFTARTQTTILYSYRVNNSLFPTQYKKDHHRPKCKNSKQWDGWTTKNVMVDHMIRKKDGKAIVRLIFPKSLDHRLYELLM